MAPPHEVVSFAVAVLVLLAGQYHRRVPIQGRKVLAGDVRINAVAKSLKFVVDPELDTLPVELVVGFGPIPEPQ